MMDLLSISGLFPHTNTSISVSTGMFNLMKTALASRIVCWGVHVRAGVDPGLVQVIRSNPLKSNADILTILFS